MSKVITITPVEVDVITASKVGSNYKVQVAYDNQLYFFTVPTAAVGGMVTPDSLKLPVIPLLLARYNKD